jgi:hypothetical protein
MTADDNPTTMSAADYAEHFTYGRWFEEYVDESYWLDSFSTYEALEVMVMSAKDEGIHLFDLEEFDYDKYFWEAYRGMEKGLS